MKVFTKYMGITAVTLLAVAPIAAPILGDYGEITVKAEEAKSSDTYKVDESENQNQDNEYKTGWISGSFPAVKDGKTINISYNGVYFEDNGLPSYESVRMPHFKGYSVDQEYVKFEVQRDPNTNAPISITLPAGIPVYTKNGEKTSTTPESNNAYQMSFVLSGISGQEKIANSTNLTATQQSDAQKWESQMKSSFRYTKNMPLITKDDVSLAYSVGSDGWFNLGASTLTPQSNIVAAFSSDNSNKTDFFMNFNDNKDKSNIFFDDNHYGIFATVTANDGTIKRNLTPYEINQYLQEVGGKGVTFHFGVHYVDEPETGNGTWSQYLDKGSKQIASKDVVVLPLESKTTNNSSNTNSNTHKGTSIPKNNNADNSNNKNNTETADKNVDVNKEMIPAVSYSSVYTPTKETKLYSDDGKLINNVGLSMNTAWQVDKKQVIDGVTYLRVATNEWVKEDDGLEVTLTNTTVSTTKQTGLYTSNGKKVTNRALAKNTPWYTDRTAIINGEKMYRVATDEWAPASYLQ